VLVNGGDFKLIEFVFDWILIEFEFVASRIIEFEWVNDDFVVVAVVDVDDSGWEDAVNVKVDVMVVNKFDNNEDFDEETNDDNDGVVDDTGEDFGLVIMRGDFAVIEDDKELDDVDWVVLVIWEVGLDVVMIVEDDNFEVVGDNEDGEFVVEVVVGVDETVVIAMVVVGITLVVVIGIVVEVVVVVVVGIGSTIQVAVTVKP